MKYFDTGIRGKGLLIMEDGRFITYSKGRIHLYSSDFKHLTSLIIPLPTMRQFLSHFRYAERILHNEPRFAIEIEENTILLQLDHSIYCVNIKNKKIKKESLSMDSKALSALRLRDLNNFDDSIIIGDYGGNVDRKAVNIYQRTLKKDDWRVVYTFAPGIIRHIHGFVQDKKNDCVYILTGDEDHESGIWKATDNFQNVEPVIIGSQQYRACQMFVGNEAFFYCTDAPSEPNFLYKYGKDGLEKLSSIRGTCIYAAMLPQGMICSTTCEPEAHPRNEFERYITNKPGSGIIGRNVDLLYITENGKIKRIANYQNDGLPLRLMQYGTIVFSNYSNGKVMCTPISVRKKDFHIHLLDFYG